MEPKGDALLRQRLAALPLESPPATTWSALREKLQQQPAPVRAAPRATPWWLALAAVLAAAAIVPGLQQSTAPGRADPNVAAPELISLMRRSRLLESEIRELRAGAPALAETQFEWESAIENDLALVDVGLAARGGRSETLWRERVRLLEELRTAAQMDSGPLMLQARLD